MYEKYGALIIKRDGHVLTVTLNRPPLNPIDEELDENLSEVFVDINRDPAVRVVVLASEGTVFCAGGELDSLIESGRARDYSSWVRSMRRTRRILLAMLDLDAPIIARVHGHAIGLGATLALFCDIVIAAESAKFADPHVQIGLTAGDGGAIIWPYLIGHARAKRYLLTGDRIGAVDACALGLISEAVPIEKLDETVYGLAQRLATLSPKAVKTTKRALNIPLLRDLVQLMDAHLGLETMSRLTEDHLEATIALRERRPARIQGR